MPSTSKLYHLAHLYSDVIFLIQKSDEQNRIPNIANFETKDIDIIRISMKLKIIALAKANNSI